MGQYIALKFPDNGNLSPSKGSPLQGHGKVVWDACFFDGGEYV